jgi:hypothetical protein
MTDTYMTHDFQSGVYPLEHLGIEEISYWVERRRDENFSIAIL